ncbi:MAG: MATE family efflux transporter [Rhodospirillaceae bacterium]|nr:MATE family efflux transporter [Rhodospirillaceae bacterium]
MNKSESGLKHRAILAIAWPVMLSNISTPLIGIVDTAVVGQIPDPAYIGAVAVGSLIFGFVFWAFGFLRMGTTGLTAQSFGAENFHEIRANLGRALAISSVVGVLIILSQWPIREIAFSLLDGSQQVEELSRSYFDIRIWAAPATLANYALLGWFIGLGRTDIGLILQLVLNFTNIALDALFVLGFGWDVKGVAFGTVLAEWIATFIGIVIALKYLQKFGGLWTYRSLTQLDQLKRTIAVNRDIMIRSIALISVHAWFMAQGAKQGDIVLAANAVLMHLVALSAFFLDGLAFAAETLVGRAVGAKNRLQVVAVSKMTTQWAAAVAIFLSFFIALFGGEFIDILTVENQVRMVARGYLIWAIGVPLLGIWAYQLDGIFIGATRSVEMRNAMLISFIIFIVAWLLFRPFENHGLWAALYVNYLARIFTLYYHYPRLIKSVPVINH